MSDCAPAGWTIENETVGDVNADGSADVVLTLEEVNAAEGKQRGRAMIVLTAQKDSAWKSAAVADRLLQCVDCRSMMAELHIKIEKGIIVVFQAQGNNGSSMSNETYRFGLESATSRFLLIDADYFSGSGPDKANSESTNYLTGDRETTHQKAKQNFTTPTRVKITKTYLDDVDADNIETAAFIRFDG